MSFENLYKLPVYAVKSVNVLELKNSKINSSYQF